MTLRIAMVAAEPSGDLLGAGLMAALKQRRPDLSFEGIGGPLMQAQGLHSRVPMEKLSVMGLVEVLKHLRELTGIRRELRDGWLADPPDLFIGVDAPDFNLGLEQDLKRAGIPSVHYVCPTVWAWRQGRVKTLRRAADLVLSIFPFEEDFLRQHQVPAIYVGHPLADEIPLQQDAAAARRSLGLSEEGPVLAILPGSRMSEVKSLAADFLKAARLCRDRLPELQCVAPFVSERTRDCFEKIRAGLTPDLPVTCIAAGEDQSPSRIVLAAADLVLTASGTATLETLLVGRPMVVGYRMHWLTYFIARGLRMVKVAHIAMANLLADERLAPEFLQGECTAENLSRALLDLFDDEPRRARIRERYAQIHCDMRRDTSAVAAQAVLKLLPGEEA